MSEYNNEMQGTLFRNDKKTTESHPDYKGSAQVKGEEFWLSAWVNTSKDGKKYMKLKFDPKQAHQAPANTVVIADDDEDLLPF